MAEIRGMTTIVRSLAAAENEAEVLAAHQFGSEKLIAYLRVALMVPLMINGAVHRFSGVPDPARPPVAVYISYSVFALVYATYMWRVARRSPPIWVLAVTAVLDMALPATMATVGIGHVFETIGDTPARLIYGQEQPMVILSQMAFFLVISVARPNARSIIWNGVCMAVGVAVVCWRLNLNLFFCGLIFVPMAATVLFLVYANRSFRKMIQELRARDSLTRFLPKPVAEKVMREGSALLGGKRSQATVMFVDIRGFTSMSEQLSPEAVMEFLNDYFGHVSHLVFAFQGMVNKFIGDGLMAVWGVPGDAAADHASQAVEAALAIRAKVAELNEHRKVKGQDPIRIGMGIHTGPVVAGNLGSKELIEYTVVGDTVNLASRLESVTKEHKVDLVVSGSTWEELGGQFTGAKLCDEVIRGKQQPVAVYTIERKRSASERAAAAPDLAAPAVA